MEPNVRSVHPRQALAVYAESWLGEGRVAVFGNATHGLGSRLCDLGAVAVDVWDPDEIRARAEAERAPAGVTVQHYAAARTLPRRALDVAIVPDLGLFEDAADLVARVREMVGQGGIALLSAQNRDAPGQKDARAFDYYELFDLVAAEFAEVRMVAEVPFHGVAMVRLGDEDEPQAVSVDTQLAPVDRTAEAFVVVAGQRPRAFDPYTIIELASGSARAPSVRPVEDAEAERRAAIAEAERREVDTERREAEAGRREAEAARNALVQTLAQAEAAREQALRNVATLQVELRLRTAEGERAIERTVELEGLLRDQATRAAELEAALVERARHLSELSAEVEEKRAAAEAGRVAAAEMEQFAHRVDRAERRGGELERELAKVAEGHAGEIGRFEEALRERARAVKTLEAEVLRRDKMVRELVSTLEERPEAAEATPVTSAPAPPKALDPLPGAGANAATKEKSAAEEKAAADEKAAAEENARLREQLNRMALDIARREGEAQAAAWTVAELERKLAQTANAGPG
jgi:hypothetical protein